MIFMLALWSSCLHYDHDGGNDGDSCSKLYPCLLAKHERRSLSWFHYRVPNPSPTIDICCAQASVKMETYQPKQISGSAQGFICPEWYRRFDQCICALTNAHARRHTCTCKHTSRTRVSLAKFSTAKKLQKHHTEVRMHLTCVSFLRVCLRLDSCLSANVCVRGWVGKQVHKQMWCEPSCVMDHPTTGPRCWCRRQ